ncbi:MAG: penicillin-binding protein 2 [Gammaproteobacteria bacterium]|jgi:penicillin-binding protein 2|nr:penicillin-binding protein 2 [Gammaproteobacteria bacterium]MBT4494162.1 penicillin-binding protein 2 [Gammaproteobacteria bacterium]
MVEPLALKDHTWESRIFLKRIVVGFGILVVLTLFLVARFFYLQIVQHDVYATLSDKNRIQVQPLPPTRGLIYDRNGELLADNSPSFNLTITPERVDDIGGTLEHLNRILGLRDDEIEAFEKRKKRRRRPFESVPLLYRLTQEEIAIFSVDRHMMPGVEVEARLVRHYPRGELMVHAVGSVRRINEADARRIDPVAYAGTDHIGKIGVEKYYEPDLLGQVGYQQVEIDARGRVMKVMESTLPVPGKNLILHVDATLQQAAVDALGDRRGTVVAIEPETGGILAMVSKPGYDPNLFVTGIDHKTYASLRDSIDVPLFNRAIQGQYQPGSTIKPIIGLAGLVTGLITADYFIEDPGWFQLPGKERLYRDWNWRMSGAGGHGKVNLQKAIYRSCNVYFYTLSVKLGIDRIDDYLALFGLGVNTALDLPEAKNGLLPSREWKKENRGLPWYPGDTVNIGIGQGDMLVTPLQLATAVTVIANRGRWVAPRMLQSGSDLLNRSDATRMDSIELIPTHVWDYIIGSMEKVVHRGNQGFGENGTAWAHIGRDINYRMAGKSGTAQVVEIKQGEEYDEEILDERQRKHAWFVAFAPVDKPKIALAVLLENGGGGSEVAAPVARAILDHHLLGSVAPHVASVAGGEE